MCDKRWSKSLQTPRVWRMVGFMCDGTIPKQNSPKTSLPDQPLWLQTRTCAALCVLFNVRHACFNITFVWGNNPTGTTDALMEAVIYIMEGLSETWYLQGQKYKWPYDLRGQGGTRKESVWHKNLQLQLRLKCFTIKSGWNEWVS